jgi:hypothetical protein
VAIQIISAADRMRERRGAKVLLLGPVGVGKTWQLRTLDPVETRFLDIEAGDLSVLELPVPTYRALDWPSLRDLAVKVAGPNPSFPPTACYSAAHYDGVGRGFEDRDQIRTLFVDSMTAITTLAFRWCEQQPEAFTNSGKKDLRGAYGLLGRELLMWANHLQHARDLNIVFVGILDFIVDDSKVCTWQLQAEGQRLGRELPGIVDQIISYQFLDFGDGKPPQRGFVCTNPNPWGYPAKDRSGRLDQVEPPDLGALLRKLTAKKETGHD